jgi:dienelactone hydrolase
MQKLALLLSLIPLSGLLAQDVRLTGTVSSGGKRVPGAILTVTGMGLKDTTGADGVFSIVKTSTRATDRSSGFVALQGRLVNVSLEQASPLTLEVFDAGGNLVHREHQPMASTGQHALPLLGTTAVRGLLLARVTIGQHTQTFRTSTFERGVSSSTETTNPLILASRSAALPDTLRVTATGYNTRSIPLASYEQTLDVLLTATPVCDPTVKQTVPVAVNLTNSGAAFTGGLPVVVETDAGIPEATIFRPRDLASGKKYPILVWGNGACSRNGTDLKEFLMEIASNGYVVVVDGTPGGSGGRDQGSGFAALGRFLINPMNWVIQQNSNPCSRFYQSLDTTKLASFGFSCGGLMAYGAGFDPRMSAVMIMNSGMLGADPTNLAKVHTPIAYVLGGSSDIAYTNGTRDYADLKTYPTILANQNVGHGGTYYADNGGDWAKIAVAWFGWWLKGDATAKAKFYPATCTFCKSPWTYESKRLP